MRQAQGGYTGLDLRCGGSGYGSYARMDLPTGNTCSDCLHFDFCRKFIGEEIATGIIYMTTLPTS